MIENNCSCSVLSNKIDKSIIRRYDNNKGRKRSGLDKSKLQAVEKAIESLAVQGLKTTCVIARIFKCMIAVQSFYFAVALRNQPKKGVLPTLGYDKAK